MAQSKSELKRQAVQRGVKILLTRECWAIYDHPSDFPDHWVVRRWVSGVPDAVGRGYLTLDAARASLPEGLENLGTEPGEDPVIAEVWA